MNSTPKPPIYSSPSVYAIPPKKQPTFCEIEIDDAGPWQHTFGGPGRHKGVIPPDGQKPVHLLFCFDLRDPLFPAKLPLPRDVQNLPLYFPFQYNAARLVYRIVDNDQIAITAPAHGKWEVDTPYKPYPSHFPERSCRLSLPHVLNVDPERIAAHNAQCDDIVEMTLRQFPDVDRVARQKRMERFKVYEKNDHNGMIAVGESLWQGVPREACRDPHCGCKEMLILAVFDAIPGVRMWDDRTDDVRDIQIYYLVCPECGLICSENVAT